MDESNHLSRHREAMLEHYAVRMARGKKFPHCVTDTECADACCLRAADIFEITQKIRDLRDSGKLVLDSENAKY